MAELGAAFVSGAIGIKLHDREDHAAYLSSWLQALRNDKRCIFTAARQAQDAADWLLSHMGAEQAATRKPPDRRNGPDPAKGRDCHGVTRKAAGPGKLRAASRNRVDGAIWCFAGFMGLEAISSCS